MTTSAFSPKLQNKIDCLKSKRVPTSLGEINFDSRLIMAPMAGICNAPFRRLMEDLGAGGTVSELISAHAIHYKNKRTMDMLKLDPDEKNVGIQLFGEDADLMANAASVAESFGPKFIDINMGCPVRKVVNKGGGSALMKDTKLLGPFFEKIKNAINIPLTIKIRTGWDAETVNAKEIIQIAYDHGIEMVAIHGRTRAQKYEGKADWSYLESLNDNSPLELIGNGDLHHHISVKNRLETTKCNSLMIARGALRNPFIFLESFNDESEPILFDGDDYFEVIEKLHSYVENHVELDRAVLVQMRKLIVWFAAGFPSVAAFRGNIFKVKTIEDTMKLTEDYFLTIGKKQKHINYAETFMNSGHG